MALMGAHYNQYIMVGPGGYRYWHRRTVNKITYGYKDMQGHSLVIRKFIIKHLRQHVILMSI